MGFDVTYHPVSEQQLRTWYFDLLADESAKAGLIAQFNIDPIFVEKIDHLLDHGRTAPLSSSFEVSRGFGAAAVAGIFSRYHYVRGCMLTGVAGIEQYTRPWSEIVPEHMDGRVVHNRIDGNYSSGVFVAAEHVAQLRTDLAGNTAIAAAVAAAFPDEHAGILNTALDEAAAAGVGLLEASDIIEPNPVDLNATQGWSNRLNCDPAGAMLYARIAAEQMRAAGIPDEAFAAGTVRYEVSHDELPDPQPEPSKRRRWFKR